MPDVDAKTAKNETAEQKGIEKRELPEVTRSRDWDAFSFSLMPSDFLGNPFSFVRRFQEEMDRRMARFRGNETGDGVWNPTIEVAERNGQFEVHAELPGLKREDIRVEVTDDALIIQGERKYEREETKGRVYRSERRYGKFCREIPLPEGASAEQAKAQFRGGLLQVTLPVPEQKRNRREIPIDDGSSPEQTRSEQKK